MTSVSTEESSKEVHSHTHGDGCCGGGGGLGSEPMGRRGMLQLFIALVALAWGAVAAYPLYRYLTSGVPETDPEQEIASVKVGKADQFKPLSGKNFQFGSKPALLVRDAEGSFHAFNAQCTHLGCTVQFNPDKGNIWCACHSGMYDPVTGKNIAGPPPKPLQPLKAEVINGDIIVTKA